MGGGEGTGKNSAHQKAQGASRWSAKKGDHPFMTGEKKKLVQGKKIAKKKSHMALHWDSRRSK